MNAQEILPVLGEIGQGAYGLYGPAYAEKITAHGFDPQQSPEWFLLMVSLDFEPETTSAARFVARYPYTNPRYYEDGLAKLAGRGLIEPVGAGEYRITAEGHTVADEVLGIFYGKLAGIEPLPAADMQRLLALLGRVVEHALTLPEPADKTHLRYNRHSDLGPDGPPTLRVLQYSADLNSFRDDAHLGAWRPHGVSGPAWEAFTFIWRDEAKNAAELAEKLANRRLTADDYTAALTDLVNRGWIEPDGDAYRVTGTGAALRQEVEDQTDRYYYAAWAALNEAELNELGDLAVRLRDALKAMQPEPQA